ncbi:MAG: hypothetical protein AABZ60_16070, partial [Planctomycetota bacterium]
MKLELWLNDPEQLARRFSKEDLKSLKSVPEQTVCLLLLNDGTQKILLALQTLGSKLEGEAVLFKNKEISLLIRCSELLSKEGLQHSVAFVLQLYLETSSKNALIDFAENVLKSRPFCQKKDLLSLLEPEIQTLLKRFLFHYESGALLQGSLQEKLFSEVKELLKRPLQQLGLSLLQMMNLAIESEDFKRLQDEKKSRLLQEEHTKTEEARLKAEKQILLLEEEKEKERAFKRQQWLKELSEQDQAHRSAQEQKEFEVRLHRKKKALEEFQGVRVEALIAQMDDPQERYSLLKMLIEKDMTPEQLEARLPANVAELTQKVAQLESLLLKTSGEKKKSSSPSSTTHCILLAVGNRVVGMDPRNPKKAPVWEETFPEEMGWIRSVSLQSIEGELSVLAGAVQGVCQKKIHSKSAPERFLFPHKTNSRNGCNSVAFLQDHFYATHSEQHLWRWHYKQYTPPESLLTDRLKSCKHVRGVMAWEDKLYFAADRTICCIDTTQQITKEYALPHAVTCFRIFEGKLYVGTQEGELYLFDLKQPESGELLVRFKETLYMMKTLLIQQEPHLLLGHKQYGPILVSLSSLKKTFYQGEQAIRWIEGNEDFLVGVDTEGYHLYIWE